MAYSISFDPLWKTLIDQKMTKTELTTKTKLSKATIAKIGKNESVTLDVVGRICDALDCSISDVVEIRKSREARPSGLPTCGHDGHSQGSIEQNC